VIRKLGDSRKKWVDERKRWNEWEQSLLKDEPLDEVKLILERAQKTIDTALSLILQQLKPKLAIQQKAGNIQTMTTSLTAEIEGLVLIMKHVVLVDSSPPMFSYRYFAQFRTGLWYEVLKGLEEIKWPGTKFFSRQGWIVAIQALLSLALVIVIFRYRHQLESSKRGRFVAKRPFSAGLFVGLMALSMIYEGAPATLALAFTVVAAISFARLLGGLIEASWKSYLIYGMVIFSITARLFDVVSLPLPLFRLYIFLAALVGLSFFVWWAVRTDRRSVSLLYTCGFWFGSFLFVVVLIAEFFGRSGLSDYMFRSSVRTILVVLVGWLFMLLARCGLDWIFRSSTIQRAKAVYSNTAAVAKRLTLFVDVLVGFLVLSSLLSIWRVYSSPSGAIKGLLSSGFDLGSQRISVGLLIVAVGLFFGSFLISWVVQKLFVGGALAKHKVGTGVKISIARLIHYALISIGFFLALLALGFELTKLTIVVSAFGIGIGFGLQTIVNNFVCGLILLFERPVRVGDYIEIGGKWVNIKRIGLRSTTVLTMERADVIIPNSDLITNQVTNWTLTDQYVRRVIQVGVAYGSDVPLVMDTLMKCATSNSNVMIMPEPQVFFRKFGESSLDFELRICIENVSNRYQIESDIHQEIDRSFRQAGIVIAFPQRDLHVRDIEKSFPLTLDTTQVSSKENDEKRQ
jgi:small-conductance mechanosensitive channel